MSWRSSYYNPSARGVRFEGDRFEIADVMLSSYVVVDKKYNTAYTIRNDRPFKYDFGSDTPANLFYQAPQQYNYDLSIACQGRSYDSIVVDDFDYRTTKFTNTPTTNKMIVRTRSAIEARFSTEEVGQIILQDVRDGHTVKLTLEELEATVKWVKSENRKKVVAARKLDRTAKRDELKRLRNNVKSAKTNLKAEQASLKAARS